MFAMIQASAADHFDDFIPLPSLKKRRPKSTRNGAKASGVSDLSGKRRYARIFILFKLLDWSRVFTDAYTAEDSGSFGSLNLPQTVKQAV